jgi:hypothetical protein
MFSGRPNPMQTPPAQAVLKSQYFSASSAAVDPTSGKGFKQLTLAFNQPTEGVDDIEASQDTSYTDAGTTVRCRCHLRLLILVCALVTGKRKSPYGNSSSAAAGPKKRKG